MSNPSGYCKCGCGQKTNLASHTDKKRGHIRGTPIDYIHGHNYSNLSPFGLKFLKEKNRWAIVCRPGQNDMHFARAVMEAHLKRPLETEEHVHHVNGDSTDDRLENLQLLSIEDHGSVHSGKYSDQEMLDKLKELYVKLGHVPTSKECNMANGLPDGRTYFVHFGTWENALKKAGLEDKITPEYKKQISRFTSGEMLIMLKDLAKRLGKKPTGMDIDNDSLTPSSRTYCERFGGVIPARKLAGLEKEGECQ